MQNSSHTFKTQILQSTIDGNKKINEDSAPLKKQASTIVCTKAKIDQ